MNTPAFPSANARATASGVMTEGHAGMSLRDYMAIHASEEDIRAQGEEIRSAQMRSSPPNGILPDGWRLTARYMHADAMLKAREA
jgi:hypothetical protein